MKYEWLLFDLDGTLLDFEKAEAIALERTFFDYEYIYNGRVTEHYHRVNGQIWREFEGGLISQDDLRAERFARLFASLDISGDPGPFSTSYEYHLGQGSYPLPGAQALIETLAADHKLLLITNGITEVQRPRIAVSPIRDYFQHVIISGEVGSAKPSPHIFDAAFLAMNHPAKERCLIIGDSLSSDIRGGRDYGIDTCWFNPKGKTADPHIQPTYQIQRLEQLFEILSVQ